MQWLKPKTLADVLRLLPKQFRDRVPCRRSRSINRKRIVADLWWIAQYLIYHPEASRVQRVSIFHEKGTTILVLRPAQPRTGEIRFYISAVGCYASCGNVAFSDHDPKRMKSTSQMLQDADSLASGANDAEEWPDV